MDTITKPVLTASLLLLPLALPAGLENDILPLFRAPRRSLSCVNQSDVRLVAPVKTSSQLPNNWCGSGIYHHQTSLYSLCDFVSVYYLSIFTRTSVVDLLRSMYYLWW